MTETTMRAFSGIFSLFFVIIIGYFFILKPEKKKRAQHANVLANLKTGIEVITIGGIIGTVIKIDEDAVLIETGFSGTRVRMTKDAIERIVEDKKVVKK